MATSSKLFLWDHPMSSYAQKIRITLREKGIPFDMETPQGLGAGTPLPGLESANLRVEVPALVDGDFKIFDSKIIFQYLEDKYPEHSLLPKDPKLRAKARMIQEICDGPYEAANWVYMELTFFDRASGELLEKMKAEYGKQIRFMQGWLEEQLGDGDFFAGDVFSVADATVIPLLNRSRVYGFGAAEGTRLQKWFQRVMERPAVKQTADEMEAMVTKLSEMWSAGQSPFKAGAGGRREYRDYRLEMMIKSGGMQIVLDGLKDDTIRFSWPSAYN